MSLRIELDNGRLVAATAQEFSPRQGRHGEIAPRPLGPASVNFRATAFGQYDRDVKHDFVTVVADGREYRYPNASVFVNVDPPMLVVNYWP